MDVQLYVYDLSRGLARQMSRQFLGTQIDAVYHTSLVFGNIEYFFGLGIQTCYPGSTHHGRPMEVIPLGQTSLPMEVVLEYLESMKQIYTPESYDLFAHNCNNFSNDLCQFLLGRAIPEHITSLPRRVLDTPFGQMLRPQLDSAMRATSQAPLPPQAASTGLANGAREADAADKPTSTAVLGKPSGEVYNITTLARLIQLLENAQSACAVIFFTSATCPPCKLVYPIYDELAAEGKDRCFLIKVDISQAREIGSKYDIRATPTFMTFLKGKHESTWSGASPAQLKGSIRMLIESAFPAHPHEKLNMPTFRRQSMRPLLNSKVPPLEKLEAKMGSHGKDAGIVSALAFIKHRGAQAQKQEVQLPDMSSVLKSISGLSSTLPPEIRFTAYDILRLLMLDPRASGYCISSPASLAEMATIFSNAAEDGLPYSLQLCALHAACSIFSSTPGLIQSSGLLADESIATAFNSLNSAGLQDRDHVTLRVAAASLAFNMSTISLEGRMSSRDAESTRNLSEAAQVELAAALIQGLGDESESGDVVKLIALSLGRLLFLQPAGSEISDLYEAMEAKTVVASKTSLVKKEDRLLMHEISSELLGKGLS